ncbi:hypothetical protein AGMMS5026_10620 [Endomicrobiia bacterium]|nr:hypothetical protein AGMMS49995_10980 [Endomicrobiia bacterium]GHT32508.1 hypothetical protein AGMMS5026_10620 [Endomicrobiia bacterium]
MKNICSNSVRISKDTGIITLLDKYGYDISLDWYRGADGLQTVRLAPKNKKDVALSCLK